MSDRDSAQATLAPGEEILVDDSFMYSTVAFYLMTRLVLTNRRLYAERPNTILGLVPVGKGRSNFPIENIAGVNAGTRFNIAGLILGAFGVLLALGTLPVPELRFWGFLLLIVGLSLMIGAPKQAIEVMNSGGGVIRFPVSFFERGRTFEFTNDVAAALAGAAHAPRSSKQPVSSPQTTDPERALRTLEQLRSQGLITEAEYTARRESVIANL